MNADQLARKQMAEDAHLVAAELAVYGEVRSDEAIEAAARLCGYLIEHLGFQAP